jgi:hypothetical protein
MCAPVFAGPQTFSGRVEKGERYEHPLDNNLVFRLSPNSAGNPPGWVITIAPKDFSREDYVWVVTPPYRFYNPRYIDISYGTSAREAVEMSPREFAFVTSEEDFKTANQQVDILLWPYNYKDKEIKAAQDKLEKVPKKKGVLTITNADLQAGGDGIQEINAMDFKVELE